MKTLEAYLKAIDNHLASMLAKDETKNALEDRQRKVILTDPKYLSAKPATLAVAYLEDVTSKEEVLYRAAVKVEKIAAAELMKAEARYKAERNVMLSPLGAQKLNAL